MAKVLVVTSGKAVLGRPRTTAALGAALAEAGQNVVVVDFDVGLRKLDLILGVELVGHFRLHKCRARHRKAGAGADPRQAPWYLSLLPASQTRDKDCLTEEGVASVIAELREKFDWVICDSPAGIKRGPVLAMRFADVAVIVTNPEVSSVRNSASSDRYPGYQD